MQSSSYYYNLHNQHWAKAKKYQKWIDYLSPLKSKLENNFDDDVRLVNNKIDDLQADLKCGVRLNDTYTKNAEDLENKKEESPVQDTTLSAAISSIGSEISSLQAKKANEEQWANEAYQNYLKALEEEKREAQEALERAMSAVRR